MDYKKYIEFIGNRKPTFEQFYKENPEFFEQSWYKHREPTKHEMNYLNYLSAVYNVKSPQGLIVPYIPYSWQITFHQNSILIKKENTQYDYIMKGRGISYSYSVMIEAINVAMAYPGTLIPVVAHRLQSATDIVKVGRWLCEHANIQIDFNKRKDSELEIYTKYGSSIIRPYPSGSPDAVDAIRSGRPVMAIVDEAGYIRELKALRDSIEGAMQTKETKIVIGGTPKGKLNHFWEMHTVPLAGYQKYTLPAFNEVVTPINIHSLKPLVWWYDIDKIKDKLTNDVDAFNQEYQIAPFNDKDSAIPIIYIENANGREMEFKDGSYILMGVDIATESDYAVISAFETNGFQFKQVYLKYYKRIALDDFEMKIRETIDLLRPEEVRVDTTGIGTQIGQRLTRDYNNVISVNFSSSVLINNEHINVKKYMTNNFIYLMQKSIISLITDELQTNHIASVDKAGNLNSKNGHNDIFVANALALMPLNYKNYPHYKEIERVIPEKPNNAAELLAQFRGGVKKRFIDKGTFGWSE